MDSSIIYFNKEKHLYTNIAGISYISATTLAGKYEEKFDEKKIQIARACEKIGRNPNHPKYLKYRYKKASEILAEWEQAAIDGCDRSNTEHDYLETNVKEASGYYSIFKTKYDLTQDRIQLYTINDILSNPHSGNLDLSYFIRTGIKDKYPKIFEIIQSFVNDGWKIYSEVAVYNNQFMISGLIDILFVKGKDFVILDWKTNKADIRFDSGFWEKDNFGNISNYKATDDTFKYPLHKLPYSIGNKYTIQLSLYDWLAIKNGLNFVFNILCHIRHENYNRDHEDIQVHPDWMGKTRVDILPIDYREQDINNMIMDYQMVRTKGQHSMF